MFFNLLQKGKSIKEIYAELNLENNQSQETEFKNILIEIYNNNFFNTSDNHTINNYTDLTIYLTDRCNLNCSHCYRYERKVKKELSAQIWKKLLQDFINLDHCGHFVTFTGGEISLRNDFAELLAFSHSLGLKNILLSNGTVWEYSDYNKIVNHSYEIQISLDGITEDQNDEIRGNGTYKKILKSLKTLVKISNKKNPSLRIALAMTFLPKDLQYIEQNIRLYKEKLENNLQRKIIFRISTRLKPGRKIEALTPESQFKYYLLTSRIKNLLYEDEFFENKLFNSICFHPYKKVLNCGFGQSIGVQPNGDVFACSESTNEFVGNITKVPLNKISNSLKTIFLNTSIYKMKKCTTCDLKYICGGGCRLENQKSTGSYLSPYLCSDDLNFKKFIYNIMADKRKWSWSI
jgi:radical SAM protein with 4Fe4S-binding SPASM domain